MTSECPNCKSPVAREGQRFCYRCGHELTTGGDSSQSQESGSLPQSGDSSSSSEPNAGPDQTPVVNSSTTPQQGAATEVIDASTVEANVDTTPASVAPPPDATLHILLPTGDVFDRELFHSDIQLGKGPRNDIVIADPAVSSAHAMIRFEQGQYSISDLSSRNGLYVNGKRITEPYVLRHGDVIGMGLSKLTFRRTGRGETEDFQENTLAIAPPQGPLPLTEQSLARAVVAAGLVEQAAVDRLQGAEARGRRLYRALVEERLASEDALRDQMSGTFQIPSIDLEAREIDEAIAVRLPSQLARDHQVFAVGEEGGSLILAVADPTDTAAVREAERELGGKTSVRLATASQIAAQIDRHYAPKLIGVLPSGEKLEYAVAQHETAIGKAAHNQIVLTDPTVSNTHAIVIVRGGGYSIVDLGSRNGTFVNGQRLGSHAHTLRHGDTIQLGQTVLTFRNPGETAANITAVLSAEALEEVKKRAASSTGERAAGEPSTQPAAATPATPAEAAAASAGSSPGSEAVSSNEDQSDAEKKKKKKKKGKDERMRAAYISAVSRVLAQVIAVLMSVGLALYLTRSRTSDSEKPVIQTNTKGKARLKIASVGAATPFAGGTYEASGVVYVPAGNGVLIVDDNRPGEVLWMQIDETGREVGQLKPIQLGVTAEDPEGITSDGSYFYIVGSQSKPNAGDQNSLVRFAFDAASQTVQKAEALTNLRDFLTANVPELKDQSDKKGSDGGLNIEGIAWDLKRGRWLLGLRSPLGKDGQALIVAVKLRNPAGSFSADNLQLAEPHAIPLPLGSMGVRDIQYDAEANAFLIIAGAPEHHEKTDFTLWEWNGDIDQSNAESNPREVAKLDAKMKPEGVTHVETRGRKFIFIVGDSSGYFKLDYSEAP